MRVSASGCAGVWHTPILLLFPIFLFLTSCSCSEDKKPDTSTDTSTETSKDTSTETDLDGGIDTDTNDTETENTITDAGLWEWVDIPDSPDCGVGCQQVTFNEYIRGDDYDVWEDLLVYVDDSQVRDLVNVVDVKNRKKLKIPYAMPGCTTGVDKCWQREVAIYENTVFYSNAYKTSNGKNSDQIVKVDLDKKTQQIIWSRDWPDGASSYPSPYNPDAWGDRLVYRDACDFIPNQGTLCLFESPWIGEENHSVLYNEAGRGPKTSLWDNILVTRDFMFNPPEDIYGYDFTKQEWFAVTNDDEYQAYPRINENRVVWMDWRYGNGKPIGGEEDWVNIAVFVKDIKTDEEWHLTDGSALAVFPDVFGDIVVWSDYRHCPDEAKQYYAADHCAEIYGYNLVTEKEVRISNHQGSKKRFPRIWGDRAFATGSDNGYHYYTYDIPEELKTQ